MPGPVTPSQKNDANRKVETICKGTQATLGGAKCKWHQCCCTKILNCNQWYTWWIGWFDARIEILNKMMYLRNSPANPNC